MARDDGGTFIVFEGIDGAGTTTQAERYAEYLRAQSRVVHGTREPSAGPIGSMIRMVLNQRLLLPPGRHAATMALLFAADRLDHLQAEIEPHLADGDVVISDRFDLSSLAYQSATSDENAETTVEWIRELNRFALRPSVTVVLDVTPEVAAARRAARGGALELFDDSELQSRLALAYREAERLVPGDRIIHIDGNGSVDDVHAEVVAALAGIVGDRRAAEPPASGLPEPSVGEAEPAPAPAPAPSRPQSRRKRS